MNTQPAPQSDRGLASLALKYAAGAVALAGAGQAQAGLVVTAINESWTGDSRFIKFTNFAPNATSVTVGLSTSDSHDFEVRFASPAYGFVGRNDGAGHSPQMAARANGVVPDFNQRSLVGYAPGSAITGATLQDYGHFRTNGAFAPGWSDQTTSYSGFSLTFGGNTYYGWMELTPNVGTLGLTLGSIGINTTPGAAALTAGSAIPEPAHTAIAFAAGAAGLAALRRRRRQALAA